MKRILSLVLVLVLALSSIYLVACSPADEGDASTSNDADLSKGLVKVAFITDGGEISDQSFNQAIYEATKKYCDKNKIKFEYFKPSSDADEDKVVAVEQAMDKMYNVILVCGYKFSLPLEQTVLTYPDIDFIGIDMSEEDFSPTFTFPKNLFTSIYQEEVAGYLAGFAAVALGYKKIGFAGGMAVPAVMRYGYGFVQGADSAAQVYGIDDVEMKYAYANQFYGDTDITAAMDTWYKSGTELVFACGGALYTSVAEAAAKVKGKMIGVDVDQKATIDGTYGDGMTVTSAVKGVAATVNLALDSIRQNHFDGVLAGKSANLGIVSDDIDENYVGLAYESTQFNDRFTLDKYKELVSAIHDNKLQISADVTKSCSDYATHIKIEDCGNLK